MSDDLIKELRARKIKKSRVLAVLKQSAELIGKLTKERDALEKELGALSVRFADLDAKYSLHGDRMRALENPPPIPLRLNCPGCGYLHVDEGEFATRAHHTHACQACGLVWRPAVQATVGVRFLPGFKDGEQKA